MTLDKSATDKHTEALKELKAYKNIEKDDTLKVNYRFNIEYLGNIVECLKAVRELCQDQKIIKQANCNILQKGSILCYEVFKELEALIRRIK